MHFAVYAIPLSRPDVVRFLSRPRPPAHGAEVLVVGQRPTAAHGAEVLVVGQRPTAAAETTWMEHLASVAEPTVNDLLWIDDPHHHLIPTTTDRLVPVQFLEEDGFLTRNLGGWSANYFGVLGTHSATEAKESNDPLLEHAVTLEEYDGRIRFFGADPALVAARLEKETGRDVPRMAAALRRLHRRRETARIADPASRMAWITQIYDTIVTGADFTSDDAPPLPRALLLDELLGQLVHLEITRRAARAAGNEATATQIRTWQEERRRETGLFLILKGEYITGRHRRSSILIAPRLGVVVKQPGIEPFHEIELGARTYKGREENWPTLTQGGVLVTPRGRLRLTVEENLIPRLAAVFDHPIRHSTLFGLTIEPFVQGLTVQEMVLDDPARLTPALYEMIFLHQRTCELMGIENGDWHSANFVIREQDGRMVHIDWGAARPLREDEMSADQIRGRVEQVHNIAYSFQDKELARRMRQLHRALVGDPQRLERVHQKARALVAGEPVASFLTVT